MMKQSLAALRAGMHRQTGGFVDHEHQGIAIQQTGHYLFRIHRASARASDPKVEPTFGLYPMLMLYDGASFCGKPGPLFRTMR
jgi:hypothetical protein